MRLRFRFRMALAAGTLTTITIVALSGILLALTVSSLSIGYNRRGVLLTKLVTNSIEYGMSLPEKVMDRVGEQMVVSALLSAELVYTAKMSGGASDKALSAALKRVIARSEALRGYPLVDEFWITDAQGEAQIHTEPHSFSFHDPKHLTEQSQAFLPLLEKGAPPVIQPLSPRALDGESFQYVGVSGVAQPRIIQVGVGEELVTDIRDDFKLHDFIAQFISAKVSQTQVIHNEESDEELDFDNIGTDIVRIVVLESDGDIVAEVGEPEVPGGPITDPHVLRFCRDFLAQSEEDFAIDAFNADIGVVTRLRDAKGEASRALFIQHHTEAYLSALVRRIKFILITGAIMILLAVLGSIYLGRKLTRPLTKLRNEVRAFGQGDLDRRIHMTADKEFQDLADSFNVMADSLQQHLKDLKEETQRRERLESEFRIAAELQQSLLPKSPPRMPHIDLAGWSIPAREVGGDFYDFVDLGDNRLGVVIADGTDKGLPAAMLITECWSVLRALSETMLTPDDLLRQTNKALYRRIGDSGRFVTLFLMVLDCNTGVLEYAMAGHNPPLLLKRGAVAPQRLRSDLGLPLGIEPDCDFETITLSLEAGDTLLLYSDGLTEAQNQAQELYGLEQLETRFCALFDQPMEAMLSDLKEEVRLFCNSDDLGDDVTMVGLRYG